jgi:hypothetical protein
MPDPMVGMPRVFDVGELGIHLSLRNENISPTPWEVQLSGADGGTLAHDGKRWPLSYAPKDVVALLNKLNEIRFFYLPTQHSRQDYAQLRNDGSVRMIHKFTSNASGNSVCVHISAFEKCVYYGAQAPVELDRLFQSVFADAQRQANLPNLK